VLVPLHVERASLANALDTLLAVRNVAGLVLTVPHKQEGAALAVRASDMASRCGAANVLRRAHDAAGQPLWEADLFDGLGFVQGLVAAGHRITGQCVCLVGAGGAGAAIAFALGEAGASRLRIHDIDAVRCTDLVDRLRRHGLPAQIWSAQDAGDAQILVNATPLGLRAGDPLPVATSLLHPGLLVADVIMEPETTPLLEVARACGCRIQPGRPMMDQQITLMCDYFARSIEAIGRPETAS
jgi:shikimate dehydrogenase